MDDFHASMYHQALMFTMKTVEQQAFQLLYECQLWHL